jgi:FkbM family methyltransferase
LTNGFRFEFRARTPTENDYGVAYEVFMERYYDVPKDILDEKNVRLVYDLGANVGFSCLHWLATYPDARVIAYEPHPACVEQCQKNLALNGWESRVELHAAAAGTQFGRARLSNSGASSRVQNDGATGFDVAVEDFFARSADDRIDILKMDIEGGEYALLEDERFSKLSFRVLVMEWHHSDRPERDGAWCRKRLTHMGFRTSTIFDAGDCGMFLAHRPTAG